MLFDLQIFSGGVYPPSATSRTISFSISNSFGINRSIRTGQDLIISVLGFRSLVARLAPFERVGTKRAKKNFGNEKCELIAIFSATVVTSP